MAAKTYFFLTILLLSLFNLQGQETSLIAQYASHPAYWKKRKPRSDYWQQDIHYKIQAELDIHTHQINGHEDLLYVNNSPDTLREIFIHLYQNAFQPGSHYHDLQLNNNYSPYHSTSERNKQGITIKNISSANEIRALEYDNTLLRIVFTHPILPEESTIINLDFTTSYGFGSTRRRMNAFKTEGEFLHYNGTQWYPKVAVYDAKFGWNTNQHLDKEFYGDFGSFEVELTFPSNYIVEATGVLTNEKEVLPETLKQSLDLKNFQHRGDHSEADTLSNPIPYKKGEKKTWKYEALLVHDFAFTADPTYRIQFIDTNEHRFVAIAQEINAPRWQNAASYCQSIVETFSQDFGHYDYPKMVVADARDGMEYPMLTLDHGGDPGYRGLLVHEIGHNWFYGMLGSNETYRACMDEGFTQFLTAWGLEKLDGDTLEQSRYKGSDPYYKMAIEPQLAREYKVMLPYTIDALRQKDARLNKHSSDYKTALRQGGGYRSVYHKTATMLYNLQYVLGDELFLAAMQNYVQEWKFMHPYPEDFRASIIRYTKTDLNWFFDQWLETTKSIDYSIKSVRKSKNDSTYSITFERLGAMEMPLDFTVYDYNDSAYHYHIPNKWFQKKTDATILSKWYGWGKLHPTYTTEIIIPNGIAEVEIDPSHRLADIDWLNNSTKLNYEIKFNTLRYPNLDRTKYQIWVRPDLWYSNYDGLKVGLNLGSAYLNTKHIVDANFWLNSGIGQNVDPSQMSINKYDPISFRIQYKTLARKLGKDNYIKVFERFNYGINTFKLGWEKLKKNEELELFVKSLYLPANSGLDYQLHQDVWNTRTFNNSVNARHLKKFQFGKDKAEINTHARAAFLGDYEYAYINIELLRTTPIGKLLLKTRFFLQLGAGSNWAPESKLYFSGANPEAFIDNKFLAAEGLLRQQDVLPGATTGMFQFGGGLNLRGFNGYLFPDLNSADTMVFAFAGASGSSFNLELEFDRYLGLNETSLNKYLDFHSYLFADLGLMNLRDDLKSIDLSTLRMDAGIGATVTFKRFWKFQKTKPLTLRIDAPFFLNPAPFLAPDNLSLNIILGLERAF